VQKNHGTSFSVLSRRDFQPSLSFPFPFLAEKIPKEEGPGVLNFMLDGLDVRCR